MPDTPSITIVKTMPYRGLPEEWANTYHFLGTTPANDAAWKALADAIWAQEKVFIDSTVKISKAFGYEAGNESSVFQVNYADPPNVQTAGSGSSNSAPSGDVAAWVRWSTGTRNSKGRPIYLRKYFHGVPATGGVGDSITATARAGMATYAGKMTDGSLPGGFKVCGPQGAAGVTAKVPTFLTTRTLKRRGKDPS